MAGSVHPHSPRNATAHRAAQTILHLPQWSRAKPQQVAEVRGLCGLVPPLILFVISYVNGGFDVLGIWMGCDSCYSTSTPLDPCSTSSPQRRSVRSKTLAFRVQIPRILSRSALAGCGRRCATLIIVESGLQENTSSRPVRNFSTSAVNLTFWMAHSDMFASLSAFYVVLVARMDLITRIRTVCVWNAWECMKVRLKTSSLKWYRFVFPVWCPGRDTIHLRHSIILMVLSSTGCHHFGPHEDS